jgi:ribulose-phosphate 3-epimerase
MIEVVPAILVPSFQELRDNLLKVRGLSSWVQIDVCDGYFVPSRTWPMNPGDRAQFEKIMKGDEGLPFWEEFNFEVDLMVNNPEKVISDWVSAGAGRVAIHIEARHEIDLCRSSLADGIEFGIALGNETPLSRLGTYAGKFDYIQLMGIAKVGKQGQSFDERVLNRIREAKIMFPGVTIQIDGSVNGETAELLVEAGANRLVSGSYILRSEDPKATIKEMQILEPHQ